MNTLLVALAALCWGVAGGIAAVLLDGGWDAFVIAFYRGAVGLLCVLVWLALRPGHSGLSNPRLWGWSVVAGLGVAGNFAFYFVSIGEGSVAVAATLMYCAPAFVYLVSFALRLERPTGFKVAALAVVLLGIVLLTGGYRLGAVQVTPLGIVAGLLAGVSYALFIFGFKYAARRGTPQAVLAIAFAVLAALLFRPAGWEGVAAVPGNPDWPLFAGLGVLGAGVSFGIYLIGLSRTTPAVASVVAMIEPVTAALFGILVLNQGLSTVQGLGMGLILVAVTLLGTHGGGEEKGTV